MFKKGMFYVSDFEGTISGPFKTYAEAYDNCFFDDIVLLAVPEKAVKETKEEKVVVKPEITLDFEKKLCIVAGTDVTLDGTQYTVGTHELEEDDLKTSIVMIEDSYKLCPNTVIIGTPPMQGEYLNDYL
jgi:hypothetical protein